MVCRRTLTAKSLLADPTRGDESLYTSGGFIAAVFADCPEHVAHICSLLLGYLNDRCRCAENYLGVRCSTMEVDSADILLAEADVYIPHQAIIGGG